MKHLHLAIFSIFLILFYNKGWADTITPPDPTMIIIRGGDPIQLFETSFSFSANSNGGGFIEFENDTGQTLDSLLITTKIATGPHAFTFGSPSGSISFDFDEATGNLSVLFSGLGISPSYWIYPPEQGTPEFHPSLFSILLNDPITGGIEGEYIYYDGLDYPVDPGGSGGWIPNSMIYAVANVPEPGTCLLLLTGLLGVFAASRSGRTNRK